MMSDTRVQFHLGIHESRATVLCCEPDHAGRWSVVTDQTPFHPVSHLWPDQPGDQGWMDIGDRCLPVIDTLTGTLDQAGVLLVDDAIVARRGDPGCSFMVVHQVQSPDQPVRQGQAIRLRVDQTHRHRLSLAHTACHLASLALNQALEPFWRKHPGTRDGAGHIDFDRLAITTSRLTPCRSLDHYRIGKSLKKKGFQAAELAGKWNGIEARVNQLIGVRLASGGSINIEAESERLSATRTWVAEFGDGTVIRVPCGGTHVPDLKAIQTIEVHVHEEDGGLRMETHANGQP